MVDICQALDVRHYFKNDLQAYLPDGYPNVPRQVQHN